MHPNVHHVHEDCEYQVPNYTNKNSYTYLNNFNKIHTEGIKWNIVSPKSVPTARAVNTLST